jgi:membrane protease YdiL (CAAX protease family)
MNQTQDKNKSRHQQIFWLLLMGLLILRMPLLGGMDFFNIKWEWAVPIYQIGTYLLTAFLIWWEIDNLAEYHIDPLALIIIILFKPIQTLILKYWGFDDNLLTFPSIPSILIWLIAIAFTIAMFLRRTKIPRIKPISLGWIFIGAVAGLLTMIILSFPMSFQIPRDMLSGGLSFKNALRDMLPRIPEEFAYQLGYAAISEEPLFRGFLWGYLRKMKWHEVWIWLFQAGLFTFSHIYYINRNPISFWIIVPVCALVLGWLAWRSRTTASSMVAHGMMNATGYAFGYLVAILRLG